MAAQNADVIEKARRRSYPGIMQDEDGSVQVRQNSEDELQRLYCVQTAAVGKGLMMTALNSSGIEGDTYREMITAMASEIEPQDAVAENE